jgi:hypothetical protein
MGTGFDSIFEEPLQVSWISRKRNRLYESIPKSIGFSQSQTENTDRC